jgi:hypothetical protein
MAKSKDLNRIKVVLVEKHQTSKWLAEQLGNTIKSTRNVDDSHWPHLNNTYLDFVYKEDGRVKLNPNLTGLSQKKGSKLIQSGAIGTR